MTDAREPTADRILDAARRVFVDVGVARARMGAIAAEAGCSRATLYRRYPDREALLAAYAVREGERVARALRAHLATIGPLSRRLVAAVLFCVDVLVQDEAVAPFVAPEASGVTGGLAGRSAETAALAAALFEEIVAGADGTERPRDGVRADEAGEWLMRVVLSLATVPGPVERTRAAREAFLARLLVPSLVA